MKKALGLLTFIALATVSGFSQSSAEGTAVMQPVITLFTGMNLGDSAMVRSAFTKEITMATVGVDKTGKQFLRRESSLKGFLKAVGTPHTEAWSEPIWDTKIEIDGNFAQVWTKYAFYVGKKFSHCGSDAFHLVKEDGAWKIFHLADTRQTQGCNVPSEISAVFK